MEAIATPAKRLVSVQQAAKLAAVSPATIYQGKTVAQLTGREATWQNGQTDIVGPAFPATWAGSPEEAAQAERQKKYRQSLSKKL